MHTKQNKENRVHSADKLNIYTIDFFNRNKGNYKNPQKKKKLVR